MLKHMLRMLYLICFWQNDNDIGVVSMYITYMNVIAVVFVPLTLLPK